MNDEMRKEEISFGARLSAASAGDNGPLARTQIADGKLTQNTDKYGDRVIGARAQMRWVKYHKPRGPVQPPVTP